MNKLGVIIPYRDRKSHLNEFTESIIKTLREQQIKYHIIVVEQTDGKPFNRGMLLNIGVKEAVKVDCNYVVLHDVDMIPDEVDYSYIDIPVHLATDLTTSNNKKSKIAYNYFGGVTMFPVHEFIRINGYSNKYWGWGFEDDDLLYRLRIMGGAYDKITDRTPNPSSVSLKFNGVDSSIKIPMDFKLRNYTAMIICNPDKVECDEERDIDEYTIFNIPGYDTGFSYNSFKRYKFETWNKRYKNISLNSSIETDKQTCLIATVNIKEKRINFYQDGELVDKSTYDGVLLNYKRNDAMFIGRTFSDLNKRIPYKGTVSYFALWNHSLEHEQIKAISRNIPMGVTEKFDGYLTPHCLEVCYDMKSSNNETVFDLSGNNRDGYVYNCERVLTPLPDMITEKAIPHRRPSKFSLLKHEENGYSDGKWTQHETRLNQIYFDNEVLTGKADHNSDGYNTLSYEVLNKERINKITKITVKI